MKQDASPSETPAVSAGSDELQAAQAVNARLMQQLAAAQAEMEDFTYSVSHDLRASLRHVTAYVGLAREELGDQLPAGVASHLDTVTHAAQHMGRMIDSLTELSRLGRAELQNNSVNMNALVKQVRAELPCGPSAHTVEWQVADDLPAVLGDAAMIQQLWRHVLSNALKFTRTNAAAQVQIGWQLLAEPNPESGHAPRGLFFIRDNGAGFNPRFADKLFHAFQRLHSTHEFEGLGMGLALARKIVERHGETIQASGDVDAGCRVSFSLPLAGG